MFKNLSHKTKPKKSLGQNFLTSPHYARLMAEEASLKAGDVVLEIGPGLGMLTAELLKTGAKVVTVEKDSDLVPNLTLKFAKEIKSGQLVILEGDALSLPLNQLKDKRYKLVANIPYRITGAIFRKFIGGKARPSLALLMVQKEVAGRLLSQKESLLSLSVKVYAEVEKVADVKRGNFNPAPRVDSAIVKIGPIEIKNFRNRREEDFYFKLLRAGFAHKRKFLLSNLSRLVSKEILQTTWEKFGLTPTLRAEDTPLKTWLELSRFLLG